MKRILSMFAAAAVLLFCLPACDTSASKNNPEDWDKYYPGGENPDDPDTPDNPDNPGDNDDPDYPDRKELVGATDMVLIYGGSSHRSPEDWPESYMQDYVRYTDKNGSDHWFFDGFLLLEFMMTQYNKTLITGYQHNGQYLHSATKDVWEALVDYYFKPGAGVNVLENAIATCAKSMGNPPSKRKIFIGIPEPIQYEDSHNQTGGSTYWGSLDGREMNFSLSADRVKAVEWYIDRIREKFRAGNYKYVELAGFYWVAEKSTNTSNIIKNVSDYLHSNMYAFSWIPYYTADGYDRWKTYGFDFAYLQPNYFFNDSVPFNRLADAIDDASNADMGMEVEFDGNALANATYKRAQRLRDYLSEFKRYGVWEKRRLAYYQGAWAVRWLKTSSNAQDQALYHEFGEWVTSRPLREENQK